ncbi:MAG: META domain-containing protein [Verrucomicrobiota bacterium]
MKFPAPTLLLFLAGLLGGCSTTREYSSSATDVTVAPTGQTASLEGTAWALVRLQDEALVLPPNTRRPFIAFTTEGRMHGFTGVNRLGGQPRIDGSSISFGNVISTRMAGTSAAMAIEMRFLECLRIATAWRINGDRLDLLAEDRIVAIFNAIPNEEAE